MTNQQIPFSVLDLMPTRKDRSHTQTMRYTLEAAQAAVFAVGTGEGFFRAGERLN